MALTLFGFHDRPDDFAVTKAGLPLEECVFLLDFSRPLERLRWLGVANRWLGFTLGLLVPVVHESEEKGGYIISVQRGQPYFADIPKLWRKHRGTRRTLRSQPVGGLDIIAAFARHFPEDSK
jgi:hypothetical protein